MSQFKFSMLAMSIMLASTSGYASESTVDPQVIADQLKALQQQVELLQQQLAQVQEVKAQEQSQKQDVVVQRQTNDNQGDVVEEGTPTQAKEEKSDGIRIGGAVRTNYSVATYDDDNQDRGGDYDFNIFRINLDGTIGDVGLKAEMRFFDSGSSLKYGYVYYDFLKDWQAQAGLVKVPFGNSPYNSHNFFFSTNYYIGLEDDYDLGFLFKRKVADNWQLDVGFLKNDELGGVDGGGTKVSNERITYDVLGVRNPGEGIYDDPTTPLGEYNTFTGRASYHFDHQDGSTEIGVSYLDGGLHNGIERAGDYYAWALHLNSDFGPWNFQLQHGEYDYDVNNALQMAVGAFSFYDTIAAHATTTTANIAYNLPVEWGPVTKLQFYNDYGIIYDKSDGTADTWMNVTGFSVKAGGVFAYIDYINAKNQPFIGGSIAGDTDDVERRFNINLGYYF